MLLSQAEIVQQCSAATTLAKLGLGMGSAKGSGETDEQSMSNGMIMVATAYLVHLMEDMTQVSAVRFPVELAHAAIPHERRKHVT